MDSRSEGSSSVPSQAPGLHCFGRGGPPSMVRPGSSDHGGTALGAPRPSTAGLHVSDLGARPKRPWDNATLATATAATTFLSQQHTASGTATAGGAGGAGAGGARARAGAEPAVEEEEGAVTTTGRAHGPPATEGAGGASSKSDIIDAGHCNAARGTTSSASIGYSATKATADAPTVVASSSSSSSSSVVRTGAAFVGDDDLTDSDESVMARLAEFTELARRTAIHNEDLSRELAAEKRRVTHTNRKLEQCNSTCTELRESLALAQDTVMKLREHEMKWAESTASEMSFRAEVCALKDEYSSASGEAAALKKRCVALERENAELGERFATIAEEKRQVESRARRLLRSDRYRGY